LRRVVVVNRPNHDRTAEQVAINPSNDDHDAEQLTIMNRRRPSPGHT
jgi:hypothetical protein